MVPLGGSPPDRVLIEGVMVVCKTIIESNSYESESIVRILIALGTCILNHDWCKQKAKSLCIDINLRSLRGGYSDHVRSVCDEILSLFS